MKLIRYYPGTLLDHYAAVPICGEAVVVSRLKQQPPEGYEPIQATTCIGFRSKISGAFWDKALDYQFPIGSILGIPECEKGHFETDMLYWVHRSPATIPNSAIKLLFEVIGTRVCEVQKVKPKEMGKLLVPSVVTDCCSVLMIMELYDAFKDWYLDRYPSADWDKDYVEVVTVRRIEEP